MIVINAKVQKGCYFGSFPGNIFLGTSATSFFLYFPQEQQYIQLISPKLDGIKTKHTQIHQYIMQQPNGKSLMANICSSPQRSCGALVASYLWSAGK